MLVIALDTTSRAGSVALARDSQIVDAWSMPADRTHAERLPGAILDLLAAHSLGVTDVDVFAVASGPGSFTGLRIGIATSQGLAFAAARPVVGVSALDALALLGATPDDDVLVGVWIDAHRREVFSALYRCGPRVYGAAAEAFVLDEPSVAGPDTTLERWRPLVSGRRFRVIGDGAVAYRDILATAGGPDTEIVVPAPPLAPAVARIATRRAAEGLATGPHAVNPLYVRRPDAVLARDRRRAET